MMAKSEVESVAVGFGESPPKTASGSDASHSGRAINCDAQICEVLNRQSVGLLRRNSVAIGNDCTGAATIPG